jgi:hypothetical protein
MNDVWDTLSDELQVVIAHQALCRAALVWPVSPSYWRKKLKLVTCLIGVDLRLCACMPRSYGQKCRRASTPVMPKIRDCTD